MKKVAIFFLLVVTSVSLTSCTVQEIENFFSQNPELNTPANQALAKEDIIKENIVRPR
ncbi:hypothetical protein [Flavobacterium sp.]|uniref:hypothetical protein n=1 Tax=Flavobacterium sp. TaxID=239 RepID=UPI0037520927